MFLGSKVRRVTTLPPSVSRLSRQCGILDVSQPKACYGDTFFFYFFIYSPEVGVWCVLYMNYYYYYYYIFLYDTNIYFTHGVYCLNNAYVLLFIFLKTVRHVVKQNSGITKLLWVKDSPHLYTAGLDGIVRLYDARCGSLQNELFGHSHCILDISLSMYVHHNLNVSVLSKYLDGATLTLFPCHLNYSHPGPVLIKLLLMKCDRGTFL
jgi:WD40 repeat protein